MKPQESEVENLRELIACANNSRYGCGSIAYLLDKTRVKKSRIKSLVAKYFVVNRKWGRTKLYSPRPDLEMPAPFPPEVPIPPSWSKYPPRRAFTSGQYASLAQDEKQDRDPDEF